MRSGILVFGGVAAALLAGGGRLAYIEYADGDALRSRAEQQHTSMLEIPALRGEILDTCGRVLAGTLRRPSIFVDPTLVSDPRFAAASVAPVLGLDAGELERTLIERRDSGFVWVKRRVDEAELDAFNRVRQDRRLTAFAVRDESWRTYPYGDLAAQVLGFVGEERKGLSGIELAYDDDLRGSDGRRYATVDVRRRPLQPRDEEYVPPTDGASVVLTIDTHIQQRTEHHLREAIDKFNALWGVAIVMDPASGEVLAMATLDGQAERARDDRPVIERMRNRAIADAFEPGSVFKPFVASCAVDDGITNLDEVFHIGGMARSFGARIIHDTHPHDVLTVEGIISQSSNIGMALLGQRCGNDNLHRFVRRFGFGDPTGISLPGEHAGLVQDFSRWSGYSMHSIPMGQEISATPVQLLSAFSVFCNGGVLYRPRIVRGVVSSTGEPLLDNSRPIAVRRVLDERTAEQFRLRALVEVVKSGTARGSQRAQLPDYQVFGKTGTAQIARADGRGYKGNSYVGSFIGGAPSDQPRAAAIVSLYEPRKISHYGGIVASPAVAAILADTLKYMQVPAEIVEPVPER